MRKHASTVRPGVRSSRLFHGPPETGKTGLADRFPPHGFNCRPYSCAYVTWRATTKPTNSKCVSSGDYILHGGRLLCDIFTPYSINFHHCDRRVDCWTAVEGSEVSDKKYWRSARSAQQEAADL